MGVEEYLEPTLLLIVTLCAVYMERRMELYFFDRHHLLPALIIFFVLSPLSLFFLAVGYARIWIAQSGLMPEEFLAIPNDTIYFLVIAGVTAGMTMHITRNVASEHHKARVYAQHAGGKHAHHST